MTHQFSCTHPLSHLLIQLRILYSFARTHLLVHSLPVRVRSIVAVTAMRTRSSRCLRELGRRSSPSRPSMSGGRSSRIARNALSSWCQRERSSHSRLSSTSRCVTSLKSSLLVSQIFEDYAHVQAAFFRDHSQPPALVKEIAGRTADDWTSADWSDCAEKFDILVGTPEGTLQFRSPID